MATRLCVIWVDGPTEYRFWQAGGDCDRSVLEEGTSRTMIDDIHHNPVRRGLVDRPEDWTSSSARWYAGLDSVALEMDRTLPRVYEL